MTLLHPSLSTSSRWRACVGRLPGGPSLASYGWRLTGLVVAGLGACATAIADVPNQLSVRGELERNGLDGEPSVAVAIEYDSGEARGEWWPCDLRLTAMGCVGESHVNVYVALPHVVDLADVGGNHCIQAGGEVHGVFEWLANAGGTGEYDLGSQLAVFVLVASDHDDVPGANFANDEETRAVSRLVSGTMRVERWADLAGIGLRIEGVTSQGRSVDIVFSGPTSSSSVLPLEPPATCVPSALRSG